MKNHIEPYQLAKRMIWRYFFTKYSLFDVLLPIVISSVSIFVICTLGFGLIRVLAGPPAAPLVYSNIFGAGIFFSVVVGIVIGIIHAVSNFNEDFWNYELTSRDTQLVCYFMPERWVERVLIDARRYETGMCLRHLKWIIDDHEGKIKHQKQQEKLDAITKVKNSNA